MSRTLIDTKSIDFLPDLKDLLPFPWYGPRDWSIKVMKRSPERCKQYISPNRRGFYKILFLTKGFGLITLGANNYYLDHPSILFIHPNEIITWRKLDLDADGFLCFFKKKLADDNPNLKYVVEKYGLFSDNSKSVIRVSDESILDLNKIFLDMLDVDVDNGGTVAEDTIQAHLQLLMLAVLKRANYTQPDSVTDEFKHVHEFFQLLEKETANVNYTTPIQIKTAKEYADRLSVHPNHLNAILKKLTGQNLSTHIRNRILEESKILLLRTDWTLQDIGFAIGFADQPNFSKFFKKITGTTPADFRKTSGL
jgi:AraC family transcriptional activator of pobA